MGDDECLNGLSQLRGTFKTGATQGLAAEYAEPDFHLVQPAGRGRRVMKVNVRMLGQPITGWPRAMVFLVRAVIVQNHMNGFACRNLGHDLCHKRLEIGAFLGRSGFGLHHAAGNV